MGFIGINNASIISYQKTSIERFSLEVDVIQNPQNPVIVIMKNPSTTCNNMPNGISSISTYAQKKQAHIDRTTGRVYRFIKRCNYDKLIVLNLFALYGTTPAMINTYYPIGNPSAFFRNDQAILNILSMYSTVPIVCAWGGNNLINANLYNARIATILNRIINRQLLQYDPATASLVPFTNFQSYPLHGLYWF